VDEPLRPGDVISFDSDGEHVYAVVRAVGDDGTLQVETTVDGASIQVAPGTPVRRDMYGTPANYTT
jgi:hypothetical protein